MNESVKWFSYWCNTLFIHVARRLRIYHLGEIGVPVMLYEHAWLENMWRQVCWIRENKLEIKHVLNDVTSIGLARNERLALYGGTCTKQIL